MIIRFTNALRGFLRCSPRKVKHPAGVENPLLTLLDRRSASLDDNHLKFSNADLAMNNVLIYEAFENFKGTPIKEKLI